MTGHPSHVQSEAPLQMLKINEALLLASTEQEILAAVGLYADKDASLCLLYLDWDDAQQLTTTVTVAATLRDGKPLESAILSLKHPANDSPNISHFLSALAASENPVWFVEDTSRDTQLTIFPFFPDVRSFVAVKLYSLRSDADHYWNAVICFTWPTIHAFTTDEKYIYTAIFQFASAVVSHHRIHIEALTNVERLRELDRLKNEFLASVSHELRTPLSGILTLSDTILNGADGAINEEVRTDVEWIHKSGQQLLAVINDILDFAKLESGERVALEIEPFNMTELIRGTIALIRRTIADDKGLTIDFDDSTPLTQIWADKTRIRQVMLNLLTNAVKFSEKGTITVEIATEGQTLVVCVRDEGIGIAPEHHALIFEPFRQVNGSLNRKIGGAGLGLSICKRLIELHGGRVWLTSVLDKGSSFYFSLPHRRFQ